MERRLCILLFVFLASAANASPYWVFWMEDFEGDFDDSRWTSDALVDSVPDDPDQAYILFDAPSADGSRGLRFEQAGAEIPPLLSTRMGWCTSCGWGTFTFDMKTVEGAASPLARVVLISWTFNVIKIQEWTTAGRHVLDIPEGAQIFLMFLSGRGVLLDNLRYQDLCDCPPSPNESREWGTVKALYGR
jgi:hypothetical protein